MAKLSQLLDSINQNLIQLNKNQIDMIAKQSTTHAMVKQVYATVAQHGTDIGTLKESHFKRVGGWQMLVMIGTAIVSVGALIAALIK